MSEEPSSPSLPVIASDEAVDEYVIAGWDARAPSPGLPPRSVRAARALAEALFADDRGPPPADRLDWMASDLADFFGHVSLRARLLFRACLAVITWLGPLAIGKLPPLARLDHGDRVRALLRVERSPLALALLGVKAMLSIVYYEHRDAARAIGWDQACKGSSERPRE